HARQQRRRHRFIHHCPHARIDHAKEVHLCFVKFPASHTHPHVRRKLSAQRPFSSRQCLHQFFLISFATHRSFSANCFRAKNSLDLTVPIGTPSIPETSSNVYPSIAARSSTNRNFSGNSSIAFSSRAWNSFDTANSSV